MALRSQHAAAAVGCQTTVSQHMCLLCRRCCKEMQRSLTALQCLSMGLTTRARFDGVKWLASLPALREWDLVYPRIHDLQSVAAASNLTKLTLDCWEDTLSQHIRSEVGALPCSTPMDLVLSRLPLARSQFGSCLFGRFCQQSTPGTDIQSSVVWHQWQAESAVRNTHMFHKFRIAAHASAQTLSSRVTAHLASLQGNVEGFRALSALSYLAELHLAEFKLPPPTMAAVATLQHLTDLGFCTCTYADDGLAELARLRKLEVLDLGSGSLYASITPRSVGALFVRGKGHTACPDDSTIAHCSLLIACRLIRILAAVDQPTLPLRQGPCEGALPAAAVAGADPAAPQRLARRAALACATRFRIPLREPAHHEMGVV